MIVAGLLVTVALYAWGVAGAYRAGHAIGFAPLAAFALAIVTLAGVLIGPMDVLSDAALSWHMAQAGIARSGTPWAAIIAPRPTRVGSPAAAAEVLTARPP